MKIIKHLTFFICFVLAGNLLAAGPSEIIVKLQPGTAAGETFLLSDRALAGALDAGNVEGIQPLFVSEKNGLPPRLQGIFKIATAGDTVARTLVRLLNNKREVLWAEPNYRLRIHQSLPNDSLSPEQWALYAVRAPRAWELEKGDSAVVVGVIDTGIDYRHPDLQGQLWVNTAEDLNHNHRLDEGDLNGVDDDGNGYVDDVIGWDFTDAPDFPDNGDYRDPDNNPFDEFPGGHGTAVAGIIAAKTGNGIGIAGLAPGCRVMALRAGTASGFLEEDDIAEAILYAVQNGCRVVNMSFGDVAYSHLIKDAVDYGSGQGVLFVASAGNAGDHQLQFPAGYDETISVGASDETNNLAAFSSYGAKLDLVAPGHEIYSLQVDNRYARLNGTSFSAPMVSAALALFASHDPTANADVLRARLLASARDLGYAGWDPFFGHGLLDLFAGLMNPTRATVQISSPATLQGTREDTVAVTGTVLSPDLREYQLSYSTGDLPTRFVPVAQGGHQVLQDTLGYWITRGLPDSVYTLQLTVTNRDLSSVSQQVVVILDRSQPRVDSLAIIPLIVDEQKGYLIELTTDDRTIARLYYRQEGESDFTRFLISGYFNNQHAFLLKQDLMSGRIEFFIRIENSAGIGTTADNDGNFYRLDLSGALPLDQNFQLTDQRAGSGYFLPEPRDLDGDGLADLVAYASWPDHPTPHLNVISHGAGGFTRHLSDYNGFPRQLTDLDNDGKPELLAGYGNISYLFPGEGLPDFSEPPLQAPVSDIWAARFLHDPGGNRLLLALHLDQWHLYQLTDAPSFALDDRQTLVNPSDGSNQYGVPFAATADLDQDGNPEVVLGDYDGDLIFYEWDNAGNLTPVNWMRMPGGDATHHFATGDLDGDGTPELAVATAKTAPYIGESSHLSQYWVLDILKSDADNRYQVVWEQAFHGVNTDKGIFNGVTVSDYNGDGQDELMFTPYPHAYFIRYRQGRYQVNWYFRGVNSNAVPPMGERRFLLVGDSTLMLWQVRESGNRPAIPGRVRILAADTAHVLLSWQAVPGAGFYRVARTEPAAGDTLWRRADTSYFADSLVTPHTEYRYWIQAVDSSLEYPLSLPSAALRIRTDNPPALTDWNLPAANQISLNFSAPLGEASYRVNHFWILPDSVRPVSAVRGRGYRQVLLTFARMLPEGGHRLLLSHLENAFGVPFYRDTLQIQFSVAPELQPPILEAIQMQSRRQLRVTFSHAMERESVENPAHYDVQPDDRVIRATQDPANPKMVDLYLTGRNRMGSLGEDYYLEVTGVRDIFGQEVIPGAGNRLVIHRAVAGLQELMVFPNPLRPETGKNEITFGNVPNGCEIFIYTAQGRRVARLREENDDGGVRWNLRNTAGAAVSGGVYIYVAQWAGQKKTGKFLILK